MWSPFGIVALSTLFLSTAPPLVTATSPFAHLVARSQIVGRDVQLLSSYDYVIVGAGASGLTVANRLTENPWVKVLVIEAGDLDAGEDEILIPRYALGAPAKYFYNIPSVPQPGLNNRSELLTAGKVVGGGTAVNGMFMPRGAKADYDIWEDLGNDGWGWSDLLPYFIKSETFTPPPAALAQEFGITYDMRYHGTRGPVQSSYPPFLYPAVKLFLKAIQQFGSHVPNDYASGDALGGYWAPNTLDPVTRTRSYARTAYYDPAKSRSNLHLLPGNTVTQIIFDGKVATGVKFAKARGQTVKSVSACKEVILAAGAPHTPQILQLSGVGPKNLLNSFGIPVVSDLPGVGANFHDHPYLFTAGTVANDLNPSPANNSNTTWMAEQLELYNTRREGVYTTSLGNSAAFLPLHEITSLSNTIITKLQNQNVANFFPSGTDSSIINGFKAERDLFVKYLKQGKIAVGEFIGGTGAGMGLVLLKPFSRGFLTLKSTDAFDDPVVDFATLRNPLDLDIIIEMIKAWRRMLQTPALQTMGPTAVSPPDSVTSDADLQSFVRTNLASSLWHPSGSAPMMKKNQGGVVGPDLLVYGTKRLSIIDASIIPVCPSTHITSTMYALAEKAADIIKSRG
ncbi:alcohol oxidase [Serendipita vermifera]|nr:alcohol oxidase [Serendipita vermifera]